jgi:hypothetical protein
VGKTEGNPDVGCTVGRRLLREGTDVGGDSSSIDEREGSIDGEGDSISVDEKEGSIDGEGDSISVDEKEGSIVGEGVSS